MLSTVSSYTKDVSVMSSMVFNNTKEYRTTQKRKKLEEMKTGKEKEKQEKGKKMRRRMEKMEDDEKKKKVNIMRQVRKNNKDTLTSESLMYDERGTRPMAS